MNTTIYFIRHGDVDNPDNIIYGRRPLPLTQKGVMQLRDFALYSQKRGVFPDKIYTSPMKRAMQSAEAIQEVFPQSQVVVEDGFQEVDCGQSEGKPLADLESVRDPYGVIGGKNMYNETSLEVAQRMEQATKNILEKDLGKTVFVVTHGDPLALLRWRLLHPGEDIPPVADLHVGDYPQKGEAWRITLDQSKYVIEHGKVNSEGSMGKEKLG